MLLPQPLLLPLLPPQLLPTRLLSALGAALALQLLQQLLLVLVLVLLVLLVRGAACQTAHPPDGDGRGWHFSRQVPAPAPLCVGASRRPSRGDPAGAAR